MQRRSIGLVSAALFFILASVLFAEESSDVFWRYANDRYNRPALIDPMVVPSGADPYDWFAETQGFDAWEVHKNDEVAFLTEKAVTGEIPILCLHKLSREEDYALTPDRFRYLLDYLRENNWYLVSDHQYLERDFSRVPTGMKPIVMGSDDASHGNFVFQTKGDLITGPVKRFFGSPRLDRDSMVAILEKHAEREEGRINFTFYVSFDAIPFRQLDDYENPGAPYRGVPIIAEKIRYLDDNFILGIHTMSHIYAHDMSPDDFAQEVRAGWELLNEYAGGHAETVRTLAFPFGIRPLTPELRRAVTEVSVGGVSLTGAFDFDNKLAPPPGAELDLFDVSRFNVDNRNWERLLRTLDDADAVVARRDIIWETDVKKLPQSRYSLGASSSDEIWVLVRSQSGKEGSLSVTLR